MKIQYWKHHDDDRWYWQRINLVGQVVEAGNPDGYRTQVLCLTAMLPVIAAYPAYTIEYREKPAN